MAREEQAPYFSESLARGLLVLRAFDREAPRLRAAAVAERAGVSRAAARRFLLTLRDLGYVACDGDAFFLRPRVLDLGYHYLASADVGTLIQPLLAEIAEKTQEATTFGVLDGQDVLIVARAAKRKWDLSVSSGSRLPLLRTSLGLVLLSARDEEELRPIFDSLRTPKRERDAIVRQLKTVRRNGYALVQGQLTPDLVGLAVPIIDEKGRVRAAINVTSYNAPHSREAIVRRYLPLLIETKSQLEAALRSSGTTTLLSDPRPLRPEAVAANGKKLRRG